MKFASMMFMVFLLVSSTAFAAEKAKPALNNTAKKAVVKPKPLPTAPMNQGDFARELVTALGWDGGLSSEPKDREFLQILEGKRTFKFEAEKVYNVKTDDVSLRKNEMFGPFTGESWISGISTPSLVHMKVFLPVGGEYVLRASAKGDGQKWKIAGTEYTANSGGSLAVTTVATVSLKPGELELEMLLPTGGALDYIMFSSPDFAPIEPLDGWRFAEPLTNLAMAYVAASLFGLEPDLPVDTTMPPVSVVVSELPGLPTTVSLSDRKFYGEFSGTSWVSSESKTSDIDIPFILPQSGAYDVAVRFMGKSLSGSLDGTPITIPAKPSFNWIKLGLHRLSKGAHTLTVTIPPFGGLDAVRVTPRKASPEAYMNLAGITGEPSAVVTYAEMERYLSLWRSKYTSRK